MCGVVLLGGVLVPVKNSADKGRNQESASLCTSHGLDFGKQQGEVAVDLMLALENMSSFDAFVGRGNLDENTRLVNALFFV